MTTRHIIAVMIAFSLCVVAGSAVAAQFYIVQDKLGQTTFMEGKPGIGWTVVDGPFKTLDAAKRVLGSAGAVRPTAPPTRAADESAKKPEFFAVKDRSGRMTVTRGEPSAGWTLVSGPHDTFSEAESWVVGSPKPTALPPTFSAEDVSKDKYFVFKDRSGQIAVHRGEAGPGWEKVGGPFDYPDQAERSVGGTVKVTARP